MIQLVEDIEAMRKYYPNVPDDVFNALIELDPTYRAGSKSAGKYGKWLLNLYNKGNLSKDEFDDIPELLNQFTTFRNRLEDTDLVKSYQSLEELSDALAAVVDDQSMLTHRQQVRFAKKAKKGKVVTPAEDKYDTVFENDTYVICVPKTHEASMKLGAGTSWCTAGTEKHWYDDYTKNGGKLYIIKNKKTGERWQYNDSHRVILNQEDRRFDVMKWLTTDAELNAFMSSLDAGMFPDLSAITSDGTYTYTGGQITNEQFQSLIKKVIVDSSVTEIPRRAFMGCKYLSSVVIPDTVTSIGGSAFRECFRLREISIPDTVTAIGATAFFDCVKLSSIDIPDSVTSLGAYAFAGCENMVSAKLSAGLSVIPEQSFCGCESLETLTIPNGPTTIGVAAFGTCTSLKSVRIPNSVSTISDGAFGRCSSLTSAKIGSGVALIGSTAFNSCKNLTIYTNNEYVKQFCANNGITCAQDLRGATESLKLRVSEDTCCVASKTAYGDSGLDDNGIYYFGKKPNPPKHWRDECGVKKQNKSTKLSIKESEEYDEELICEDPATAAIGTIKNQVMQLVHDAFEFMGGSFTPEFLMQSNEKPDVEVKVKANGRNVEIIPQYKHIPDYLHIRKGITFNNAPRIIADVALDAVENYKDLKK